MGRRTAKRQHKGNRGMTTQTRLTLMGRFLLWGCLAVMVSACNFAVPQVTPTVLITVTVAETPTALLESTPTATVTSSATTTPSPTQTQTATVTSSVTLTQTATDTTTHTLTPSLTATLTHTATTTPSLTSTLTPSVTPTGTPPPSNTPTQTNTSSLTPTFTATTTQTATRTPSLTLTITPSSTLTPTPTVTASLTLTPTTTLTITLSPTLTLTITPSLTASVPPTATVPPSPTPLPIIPSSTPAPTDSQTPTATITISATALPSLTAIPSLTSIPPTLTPPRPPPPPTLTPLPRPSPLPLPQTPLRVPPTVFITVAAPSATPLIQEVPPTIFIIVEGTGTAVPGTPALGEIAPIGERTAIPNNLTAFIAPTTPAETPTALPLIAPIPLNVPANPLTRAFALSTTSGGGILGSGFALPYGGGAVRFARNPADPNQVAMVDPRGVLYLVRDLASGGSPSRPESSPFSSFEPGNAEANNALVVQVAYAPNGSILAYRIDTESDTATQNDSLNDGIWLMYPDGASRQVLRECPPVVAPLCAVDRTGGPFVYNSLDLAWSAGSDTLLINVDLPEEGRRAYMLVTPNSDPNRMPRVYRYDDATWSFDGRIVVSGRGLDGQPMIGIIRQDGTPDFIRRANEIGLAWTQSAIQQPNGRIVMLGSPDGGDRPLRLYDQDGAALTPYIGEAPAERLSWSPDRRAVLVVTRPVPDFNIPRRFYVAEVNGTVREITASVAGALAVEWVTDAPPTTADIVASPTPTVPSRVGIAVGQTLQIIAVAGANLRTEPSVNAAVILRLNFGDTIAIVEGPVRAETLLWWKVATPNGSLGWAAESDGFTQILGVIQNP